MFKLFTGKMFAFGLILLLRDKVSSRFWSYYL